MTSTVVAPQRLRHPPVAAQQDYIPPAFAAMTPNSPSVGIKAMALAMMNELNR